VEKKKKLDFKNQLGTRKQRMNVKKEENTKPDQGL